MIAHFGYPFYDGSRAQYLMESNCNQHFDGCSLANQQWTCQRQNDNLDLEPFWLISIVSGIIRYGWSSHRLYSLAADYQEFDQPLTTLL